MEMSKCFGDLPVETVGCSCSVPTLSTHPRVACQAECDCLRLVKRIGMLVLYLSDLFDNYMQQDAHEFLNYLLNTIADILQEEKKQEKQNGKLKNGNMNEPAENSKPELTWVHEIFQGTLTNETRCLNCETVSTGDTCLLPGAVLCVAWYSSAKQLPLLYTNRPSASVQFMCKLIDSCAEAMSGL